MSNIIFRYIFILNFFCVAFSFVEIYLKDISQIHLEQKSSKQIHFKIENSLDLLFLNPLQIYSDVIFSSNDINNVIMLIGETDSLFIISVNVTVFEIRNATIRLKNKNSEKKMILTFFSDQTAFLLDKIVLHILLNVNSFVFFQSSSLDGIILMTNGKLIFRNVLVSACEMISFVNFGGKYRRNLLTIFPILFKELKMDNCIITFFLLVSFFQIDLNMNSILIQETLIRKDFLYVEKMQWIKIINIQKLELSNSSIASIIRIKKCLFYKEKTIIYLRDWKIVLVKIEKVLNINKEITNSIIKIYLEDSIFRNVEHKTPGSLIFLKSAELISINNIFSNIVFSSISLHNLIRIEGRLVMVGCSFDNLKLFLNIIKIYKTATNLKTDYILNSSFNNVLALCSVLFYEAQTPSMIIINKNLFSNSTIFSWNLLGQYNGIIDLTKEFSIKENSFILLYFKTWNSELHLTNNIFFQIENFFLIMSFKAYTGSFHCLKNNFKKVQNFYFYSYKRMALIKIEGFSTLKVFFKNQSLIDLFGFSYLYKLRQVEASFLNISFVNMFLNPRLIEYSILETQDKYYIFMIYDSFVSFEQVSYFTIRPSSIIQSINSDSTMRDCFFFDLEFAFVSYFEFFSSSLIFEKCMIVKNVENSLDYYYPIFSIYNGKKNKTSFVRDVIIYDQYSDVSLLFLNLADIVISNLNFSSQELEKITDFYLRIDHYSFSNFLHSLEEQNMLIGLPSIQKSLIVSQYSSIKITDSIFSNIIFYEGGFLEAYASSIQLSNVSLTKLISLTNSLFKFLDISEFSLRGCYFANNYFTDFLFEFDNHKLGQKKFVLADSYFATDQATNFIQICHSLLPFDNLNLVSVSSQWQLILKIMGNSAFFGMISEINCLYYYTSNDMISLKNMQNFNLESNLYSINTETTAFQLKDCEQINIKDNNFIGGSLDNANKNEFFLTLYRDKQSKVIGFTSLFLIFEGNKKINILDCFFFGFNGVEGAIFKIDSKTNNLEVNQLYILSCIFINNTSRGKAGVIYVNSESKVLIKNSKFISNSAIDGGAIYSLTPISLSNNQFIDNRAEKSGGAITWLFFEPMNLHTNLLKKNSALHGNNIASEVTTLNLKEILVSNKTLEQLRDEYFKNKIDFTPNDSLISQHNPNSYYINDYNEEVNIKFIFTLTDHYNQLSLLDHNFIFQVTNIDPTIGFIRSPQETMMDQQGLVYFELEDIHFIRLYQNFSLTISKVLTAEVSNIGLVSPIITIKNYLKCQRGQIFSFGSCVICPFDSYSMQDEVKESTVCKKKPKNSFITYGSIIIPQENYWIANNSENIYKCLYEDACVFEAFLNLKLYYEAKVDFHTVCRENYRGPLCGVCSENSDLKDNRKCITCDEMSNLSIYVFFFALFYFSFYLFTILSSNNKNGSNSNINLKIVFNLIFFLSIILKRVKVYTSIEVLLSNMNIVFTGFSTPLQILTVKCWVISFLSDRDYFLYKTIGIMLFPIFFLGLALIINFIFKRKILRRSSKKKDLLKVFTFFFFIHYLFLYDVLNQALIFLSCVDVEGSKVVKMFPSVDCNDEIYLTLKYVFILPYLLLYFTFSPLCTLLFLKKNDIRLKSSNFKKNYGFIYTFYEEDSFFWEFVLIIKKIMVTFLDFLIEIAAFKDDGILIIGFLFIFIQLIYLMAIKIICPFRDQTFNRLEYDSNILCLFFVIILLTVHFAEILLDSKDEMIFVEGQKSLRDSFLYIVAGIFIFCGLIALRIVYRIFAKFHVVDVIRRIVYKKKVVSSNSQDYCAEYINLVFNNNSRHLTVIPVFNLMNAFLNSSRPNSNETLLRKSVKKMILIRLTVEEFTTKIALKKMMLTSILKKSSDSQQMKALVLKNIKKNYEQNLINMNILCKFMQRRHMSQ